jgi:multiple sugar transport system substrate-binding protein
MMISNLQKRWSALTTRVFTTLIIGAAIALGSGGDRVAIAQTPSAQPVEIVYATFLDPNNQNDPRAAAQTRMIAAFEKANPTIRVRVQVDPTQQASLRALRSRSNSPDLFRVANFSLPEFVATNSMVPLDDLLKRDKVSETDWLIPLAAGKVNGHIYGMQQDYRIPLLLYRKKLLQQAGVEPPKTWDEVCQAGGKLTSLGNVVGYAVPVGTSGGLGGAQPLAENMFSSMVSEDSGRYFADNNRDFAADKAQVIRTLQTIKDLYGKCKATPMTGVQFGYTETHDGLRAGTVAMATFGLFRVRAIESGGAGDDLGWAPPPAYKPNGKQITYGYMVSINSNTANKEAAWQFAKFMGSPEAQAIAAEGGEVVARTSVYTNAYFASPAGARQKQWSQLVKDRGQMVNYSMLTTTFNQVLGDAVQRMLLRNTSPEEAYQEIDTKYKEALAKTP